MTEFESVRNLVALLTASERRRLLLIPFLMVVAGALEMLGLGAVFIFTAALNELSAGVPIDFRFGEFAPQLDRWTLYEVAAAGTLLLIGIFALKAGLILSTQIFVMRFISSVYRRFSVDLFARYLKAPLVFHIEHGVAEIQRNLNVQPTAIFNSAAVSLAHIGSNAIAIGCLFTVLCIIDPVASLLAMGLLAGIGALYYTLVRRRLFVLGRQRHASIASAIRWVGHAIVGIREVHLYGSESFFKSGFEEQIQSVATADRNSRIVAQAPAIVNEAALVIGFLGFMLLYLWSGRSLPQLLPVMGAFGLAGVRMMGMAASMVTHIQQLQFHGPAIRAMCDLMDELRAEEPASASVNEEKLSFNQCIVLKDISFQYPGAPVQTLRNVSLDIPKGSRTALLGASGSGKTTLLSILLGLLEPSSGAVLVDGRPICANQRSWFKRVAYVPQSIFILDDTVQANVLFGRRMEQEGENEIWQALEVAQIADLVRSLPQGLGTFLGENGAKLSGGERQRIGIARALLRAPDLLVLDEATSALDCETERKLLRAIDEHCRGMTFVIATHRVESVRAYARRFSLKGETLLELPGAYEAGETLLQG